MYLNREGTKEHVHRIDQSYNSEIVTPYPEGTVKIFRVSFENDYGRSEPSRPLDKLITDMRPSGVCSFDYVMNTVTDDSVKFLWSKPTTNSCIVESYELEWSTSIKLTTETSFKEVSDLHPGTEYRFQIYAVTKDGRRGESTESVVLILYYVLS